MSRKPLVLANRDKIREIAESQNAERISLFGSTARGEDGPESDCDFIADFKPRSSLFHLVRIKLGLEDLLGCGVDVVSRRSIPEGIDSIAKEEIPI